MWRRQQPGARAAEVISLCFGFTWTARILRKGESQKREKQRVTPQLYLGVSLFEGTPSWPGLKGNERNSDAILGAPKGRATHLVSSGPLVVGLFSRETNMALAVWRFLHLETSKERCKLLDINLMSLIAPTGGFLPVCTQIKTSTSRFLNPRKCIKILLS